MRSMDFPILFLIFYILAQCKATNVLFSLLKQECIFEYANAKQCNTPLVDVFTPQNKGANNGAVPRTLFFLFTPKNKDAAEPLHLCGGSLPLTSDFDPAVDTEIFIHGWLDGVCRTAWMREMKEQLFVRGKFNVMLVDWSWGNTLEYAVAAANTKIVAEQLTFVLKNILKRTGISPMKIHLIGHSLGAHIAGYVGQVIRGIRRITGLDPAFAPYENAPPDERLSPDDAELVDIIHSNGAQCFGLAIGDSRPLGHADFYPNGGSFQPSCYIYIIESLLKGDLLYGVASLEYRICHHLQSIQFYKISINNSPCQFIGVRCRSYADFVAGKCPPPSTTSCKIAKKYEIMGMDWEYFRKKGDKTKRKFYLKTSLLCPYVDNSGIAKKGYPENITCVSPATLPKKILKIL